jgi:hypothetical protein
VKSNPILPNVKKTRFSSLQKRTMNRSRKASDQKLNIIIKIEQLTGAG